MRRVAVQVNTANVLTYLGTLYRSPADAAKEYISNAIDSFLANPGVVSVCRVDYKLTPRSITITCNTPGMNQKEFEKALQNVADSVKQKMGVSQIGRLGIGIWAFHQVGRRAEFLSKKGPDDKTIKVILREGDDHAQISSAPIREQLPEPGMHVKITNLKTSPTTARSPLSATRLRRFFAEKFDSYIRKGSLQINISSKGKQYRVPPMEITLPRIANDYSKQYVGGDPAKWVELLLWFEPGGKGKVSIRHMGIPIVEDISSIDAYGLEESVYAEGNVFGYIDADFLDPLPARTMFNEDNNWTSFLKLLDRIRPSIEGEVEILQAELKAARAEEVYKKALNLAEELLKTRGLEGLEWLRGGATPKAPVKRHETHQRTKRTGKQKGLGGKEAEEGFKVSFQELPFEDGPAFHSRFIKQGGVVQVNTFNPDYREAIAGSEKDQVRYFASIIGKEIIAYNDKTGYSNEALEKGLTFHFALQRKT